MIEPLPLSSVEHYNLVFRFVLSRTGSLVSHAHYVAIKQLLAKCLSMQCAMPTSISAYLDYIFAKRSKATNLDNGSLIPS